MKRKKFWIGAAACMLIGTASVAASSGVELHDFSAKKIKKLHFSCDQLK